MKTAAPSMSELKAKIDSALTEVTAAETSLEGVLRDLHAGVRAEKVKVTSIVEQAFARLRNGRAELARLRDIVVAGEDDADDDK